MIMCLFLTIRTLMLYAIFLDGAIELTVNIGNSYEKQRIKWYKFACT